MTASKVTLPELEVLAASSPEQLLEEVKHSTAKGFRPSGPARYEGHQILPYRQAMVREAMAYARADAQSPRNDLSA